MPRVLIPPSAVHGRLITVSEPGALHHLRDVLRVKIGDRLECFDGNAHAYAGPIVRCSRRGLVMEIAERLHERARVLTRLVLAQALIRQERFEWLIEKATELGVETVIPLITERTVVRPAPDRVGPRVTRWQRIANAAAAQCGRSTLPLLDAPRSVEELLPSLPSGTCVLMPTLSAEAVQLKEALTAWDGAGPVVVRGGFHPA